MYTETLWVSNPQKLKELRELSTAAEDYEEQLTELTCRASRHCDMTEYGWIKVGTVDHQFHLELSDKQTQDALASLALAEKELTDVYMGKLNALRQVRQELLALPAPKADDE